MSPLLAGTYAALMTCVPAANAVALQVATPVAAVNWMPPLQVSVPAQTGAIPAQTLSTQPVTVALPAQTVLVPSATVPMPKQYVTIPAQTIALPSGGSITIPAQTPLVFDVYDRWTGRSLGGMTHHVSHPGGRSYDDFPVNANSAEARRRSRFFPFGHTQGQIEEPRLVIGRDHPRTLDLRRFA